MYYYVKNMVTSFNRLNQTLPPYIGRNGFALISQSTDFLGAADASGDAHAGLTYYEKFVSESSIPSVAVFQGLSTDQTTSQMVQKLLPASFMQTLSVETTVVFMKKDHSDTDRVLTQHGTTHTDSSSVAMTNQAEIRMAADALAADGLHTSQHSDLTLHHM